MTGLNNEVLSAYFLADPGKKPLVFSRIGEKPKLTPPQQAPDPIDTVARLELKDH